MDGERGVDGAERMILQRDGGAEQRHQPIAEELVHRALVAVDGLGHEPQDAVHDLRNGALAKFTPEAATGRLLAVGAAYQFAGDKRIPQPDGRPVHHGS